MNRRPKNWILHTPVFCFGLMILILLVGASITLRPFYSSLLTVLTRASNSQTFLGYEMERGSTYLFLVQGRTNPLFGTSKNTLKSDWVFRSGSGCLFFPDSDPTWNAGIRFPLWALPITYIPFWFFLIHRTKRKAEQADP
ncbi:hypothetical protein [Haloferula sp.]|uniref:hypothetical protein n=1 Tax=Haloferula sp. TaxID=2497595 RepID=UPI00329C4B51